MFWKEEEKTSGGIFKGLAITGGVALLAGLITKKVMNSDKDKKSEEKYHEIKLSKKMDRDRQYFLVYQNNDFESEYENGYIWAPEETESGRAIFHWDNLKKVRKNDIVFSLADRKIVSVNVAKEDYFEYNLDGVDGNRVDLEYNLLDEEIDIEEYMDRILELSPDKYAPFNVMGRSNSGYLFDIGEEMGKYLMKLVKESE